MGPLLLGNFGAAMLLRVPVGFALAAASLVALVVVGNVPLTVSAQRIVAGITPFPLLAIPLFVLAGGIMGAGGMTARLLALADSLVGRLRGGLAQTNVLSSLMFGGLSGSAVADVSSLGRVLIPAMRQRDYRAAFAAATTAASSVVAPILPPSITLIVYGVVSGTSIGQLFFAGIVPGLLYVLALMLTIHLVVRRRGFTPEAVARAGDPKEIGRTPKDEVPKVLPSLVRAVPALLLPVLILGGIRLGVFTPTEAAAMAVVYAVFVGLVVYRELTWERLRDTMTSSALMVGLIMLVLAAAQLYSWALTLGRVPQEAASAIFALTENPVVLLLLMNVLLLVIGMFIEANAALIIITPILLPLATSIGVDPVQLGIIIVINLGIGLVSPPVGICLLLAAEIGQTSTLAAVKAVLPMVAAGVGVLLLITYVPAVSLWLPSLIGA
ncbi:TRAP transporter large permease [Pseudokineococcus sp. 1T1Z-3]|uniref:TRAP transporter large permease n=1 Tax=Pseudokineococcus sp. 1T1Z-3 TaxID=3132745 RepID=UPI00309B7105